jgi:inorganic pyrophosphatase
VLDGQQVKALGTLAMIDEGELDWKVFCVVP